MPARAAAAPELQADAASLPDERCSHPQHIVPFARVPFGPQHEQTLAQRKLRTFGNVALHKVIEW